MDKLDNTQTKDRIAALLRHEIISGKIADGEELTQEQIAEALGVSRMPVREALQILELEGFLWRLPNRHIVVVGINENTLHANLQLIAAVEIELITIFISSKKIVSDITYETDQQFHKQFSTLTDNRYISQLHHRLLQGYPKYIWDSQIIKLDTQSLHQSLVNAIVAADKIAVANYVRQYYQLLADVLIGNAARS